jgi:hypothetical protein
MARFIELNLVNEEGTPHPWPGTPTQHEIGTQQSATAVWIGVSTDGSTNQVYPLSTPPATILATWPRLYQGVQVNTIVPGDDSPAAVEAGEFVYYVSLEEFNRLEAACCIAIPNEESPVCMVTINWVHNDTGSAGTLEILVDGVQEVFSEQQDGAGSFEVPAGASIEANVSQGNSINHLDVQDDIDGELFNGDGPDQTFTFPAVCGHVYTITGTTAGGE